MKARDLKLGDTIRATWREYGDDANLTGVVIKRNPRRGFVALVRWNGDGDVTPEGDESLLLGDTEVELVS